MTRELAESKLKRYVKALGADPAKVVVAWATDLPDSHGLTVTQEGWVLVVLEEGKVGKRTLRHEAYHAAFALLDIEEVLAKQYEDG
jgi:hypothetical protein